MLMIGRSFVRQIPSCVEGVMGFHNDRDASGKMPTNGRSAVLFSIPFTNICYFTTIIIEPCHG